jgi:hypothetical protein
MSGLTRKEIKHDEFLETAGEAGAWIEDHWKLVLAVVGGALIVLVAFLGWRQWAESKAEGLRLRLAEAQGVYLDGDPADTSTLDSFRAIASDAGSRPEGAVARFYEGVLLLRRGEADAAIEPLERAASGAQDPLLRQNARVALGRARAESGDLAGAEAILREVAADDDSPFPPEEALMTLAELERAAGDTGAASNVLQEVVDRFPGTPAARRASAELAQ